MLALLLAAVVMLATQNWQLGLLLFIVVAGCIVYIKRCDYYQEKKLLRYLDDLSAGVSAGTVYAVKNLPIGIAMMDEKKELVWANNVFRGWIGKDAQEGVRFQNLVTGQKISKIWGRPAGLTAMREVRSSGYSTSSLMWISVAVPSHRSWFSISWTGPMWKWRCGNVRKPGRYSVSSVSIMYRK